MARTLLSLSWFTVDSSALNSALLWTMVVSVTESAITASEHGDLLADELLLHREDVRHALAVELVLAGAAHLLGLEAAHSDGHDDRFGVVFVGIGLHYELVVAVEDLLDLLVLTDLAFGGLGLGVELVGKLPRLDGLESGEVVDPLLGVEADQLASDASGIEYEGLHELGPCIDPSGKTGAPSTYNDNVVAH